MPQIGDTTTYPKQTPSIQDYLIGTDGDANNKRTHNYSIKDLVTLFLENSDIDGIIQNNKIVNVDLGYVELNTNVSDAVNALPEFQVGETEIYVFKCTKKEMRESGSIATQNPTLYLYEFTYIFDAGKGYYGVSSSNPTTPLEYSDFTEVNKEELNLPASTEQGVEVYFIQNTAGATGAAAINAAGAYQIIDGLDAYFKINNVNGRGGSTVYRFIGAAGMYGLGFTQVITANLLTLEEVGLQSTSTTNIKIVESIPLYVSAATTKAAVVNALPTFTISQNELYVFNFVEVLSSGSIIYLQNASYFLKRGRGVYGAGTPTLPLTDNDFKLNFKEKSKSTIAGKDVTYYNFDKSEEADIVDAINASTTPIVKNSTYTTVVEKDKVQYIIIGANGSYGDGLIQIKVEELDEMAINELFDNEVTFAESVNVKDVINLAPTTLPATPEDGAIVNVAGVLKFYNGTSWYTIDITIDGV